MTTARSVEERPTYTCEECNIREAIFYCSRCTNEDDPYLHCEECFDLMHRGRKLDYHQNHPITDLDELMSKYYSSTDRISRNVDNYEKMLKAEESLYTSSATSTEDKIKHMFEELKELVNVQEKRVLSQVVAIKEKRLSEFQKKFTSFNELKTKTFKKIFETNDNVENILQSTKPHLLEKALDKIIETLEESCKPIDRFFIFSQYPMNFSGTLAIVPTMSSIKSFISRFTIPNSLDWEPGEDIPNAVIFSAIIVKSNHFWVGKSADDEDAIALNLISESLTIISEDLLAATNTDDIAVDSIVCACYQQESSWHRGLVEKIYGKRGRKMVSVRFLDYGNLEEIPLESVAILPTEFTEYPFRFRLCCFSKDFNFSEREVKWKFGDLVKGRLLRVKVQKRTYTCKSVLPEFCVELYNELGLNIREYLLHYKEKKNSSIPPQDFVTYRDVKYKDHSSSKSGSVQLPTDRVDTPPEKHEPQPNKQDAPQDIQDTPSDKQDTPSDKIQGTPSDIQETSQDKHDSDKQENLLGKHEKLLDIQDTPVNAQITLCTKDPERCLEKQDKLQGIHVSNTSPETPPDKEVPQSKHSMPPLPSDNEPTTNEDLVSEVTMANRSELIQDEDEKTLLAENDQVELLCDTKAVVNGTGDPVDGTGDPVDGTGDSVDGKGDCVDGKGDSVDSKGDLVGDCKGDEEPVDPVDGTSDPVDGTGNPIDGTSGLVNGRSDPVDGKGDPVDGTGDSMVGKSNLIDGKGDIADDDTGGPMDSTGGPVGDGVGNTGLVGDGVYSSSLEFHVPMIGHASLSGSQVRPPSSCASSIGPVTSPSQINTPSQTDDTFCSFSPNSNIDLDSMHIEDEVSSKYTADHVSALAPSFDSTTDPVIVGPSHSDSYGMKLTQSEAEVGKGDHTDDQQPSIHPMVFKGAKLSLFASSALSPSNGTFWAQLIVSDEKQELYDKLFDELNYYAELQSPCTSMSFDQGDLCLAKFSTDNKWYRGKVEELTDNKLFSIRFMDFGNCDLVPLSCLLKLKSEFKKLPFQAVKCSIANETKSSFTTKECENYDEVLASTDSLSAIVRSVVEDTVYVDAILSETNEDLFQRIIGVFPASSSCSFENSETQSCLDYMEDDGLLVAPVSDTEVLVDKKRRNKFEKNVDASFSGSELSERKYKTTTIRKSVSNDKPSRRQKSSVSPSTATHLSLDKTSMNKFLHIDSVSPGKDTADQKKPDSVNGSNESVAADDWPSSIMKRKKLDHGVMSNQNTKENRNKGKGRGSAVAGKKDGVSVKKEGRRSSIFGSDSSLTESFKKKGPSKRKSFSSDMITLSISGLEKLTMPEINALCSEYGVVHGIRKSKYKWFYVDVDRDVANKIQKDERSIAAKYSTVVIIRRAEPYRPYPRRSMSRETMTT